jgi:hypothetical protein
VQGISCAGARLRTDLPILDKPLNGPIEGDMGFRVGNPPVSQPPA